MWSNSFIRSDGNYHSQAKATVDILSIVKNNAVNLFYVPDIQSTRIYNWAAIDKTVLDLTITSLDTTLLSLLASQIDDTNVKIMSMSLNNYEFILYFYFDCDYFTDVNLILDWQTDNPFINNFTTKKIPLNESSVAFKFTQSFIG
jgi:hypothetical protein